MGTKTKVWQLGNGYSLLCVYKYFHIWFLFRFTTSRRWYLYGGAFNGRELSSDEVKNLIPEWTPWVNAFGISNSPPEFIESPMLANPLDGVIKELNTIKHGTGTIKSKKENSKKLINESSINDSDKLKLMNQMSEVYDD